MLEIEILKLTTAAKKALNLSVKKNNIINAYVKDREVSSQPKYKAMRTTNSFIKYPFVVKCLEFIFLDRLV